MDRRSHRAPQPVTWVGAIEPVASLQQRSCVRAACAERSLSTVSLSFVELGDRLGLGLLDLLDPVAGLAELGHGRLLAVCSTLAFSAAISDSDPGKRDGLPARRPWCGDAAAAAVGGKMAEAGGRRARRRCAPDDGCQRDHRGHRPEAAAAGRLACGLAACSAPGLDAVASWSQVRSAGRHDRSACPGNAARSRLPVSTLGTSMLVGSILASILASIIGSSRDGSTLGALALGASTWSAHPPSARSLPARARAAWSLDTGRGHHGLAFRRHFGTGLTAHRLALFTHVQSLQTGLTIR